VVVVAAAAEYRTAVYTRAVLCGHGERRRMVSAAVPATTTTTRISDQSRQSCRSVVRVRTHAIAGHIIPSVVIIITYYYYGRRRRHSNRFFRAHVPSLFSRVSSQSQVAGTLPVTAMPVWAV